MKKKKGLALIEVLLLIWILIMIASLWRGYLVNDDFAVKALENHGFSNVEVVDRGVFLVGFRGGSASDAVIFRTRAINSIGKEVKISVCAGWPFKGATIRSE